MAIWERARHSAAQIFNMLEQKYRHGSPEVREMEAHLRLDYHSLIEPYRELCNASEEFFRVGKFFIPGDETALRCLNRLSRAVEMYKGARHRDYDEEPIDRETIERKIAWLKDELARYERVCPSTVAPSPQDATETKEE